MAEPFAPCVFFFFFLCRIVITSENIVGSGKIMSFTLHFQVGALKWLICGISISFSELKRVFYYRLQVIHGDNVSIVGNFLQVASLEKLYKIFERC